MALKFLALIKFFGQADFYCHNYVCITGYLEKIQFYTCIALAYYQTKRSTSLHQVTGPVIN